MRTALAALLLITSVLAPSAHAGVPHPFVVLVTQAPDHETTLITWAPIVGATNYVVLRGPTIDDLKPVQSSPETYFIDSMGAGMIYVVHAQSSDGSSQSSPSGGNDCVQQDDQGHVTVTASSCVHYHD